MGNFKNFEKAADSETKEAKTMTTKNTMSPEVRTVSQPSVDDESQQGFVRTATVEEAKEILEKNETEQVPEDFMHESIVAIPRTLMSQLDVQAKDPAVAFRWVNHKGNEGQQYFNSQTWGFVNATPDDVKGFWDKQKIKYQDGAMTFGDLTLMKIAKKTLWGYYKNNVISADRNISRTNVHQEALKEARQEMGASGIPSNILKQKVGFYIPDKAPGELGG